MIFSQEMELLILIQHQKSKNCVEKDNQALNFGLNPHSNGLIFQKQIYFIIFKIIDANSQQIMLIISASSFSKIKPIKLSL